MTKKEAIKVLLESKNKDTVKTLQEWEEWEKRFSEALDMAIETLEDKCGEWVLNDDQVYECRDCGYVPSAEGFLYFNFCPNCGKAMRKGEDNDE